MDSMSHFAFVLLTVATTLLSNVPARMSAPAKANQYVTQQFQCCSLALQSLLGNVIGADMCHEILKPDSPLFGRTSH